MPGRPKIVKKILKYYYSLWPNLTDNNKASCCEKFLLVAGECVDVLIYILKTL